MKNLIWLLLPLIAVLLLAGIVVVSCKKYEYGPSVNSSQADEVVLPPTPLQNLIAGSVELKAAVTANDAAVSVCGRGFKEGDKTALYPQKVFKTTPGTVMTAAGYETFAKSFGFVSGAEATVFGMNQTLKIRLLLAKYPTASINDYTVAVNMMSTSGDPILCKAGYNECVWDAKIRYNIALIGIGLGAVTLSGSTLGIATPLALGATTALGAANMALLYNSMRSCGTKYQQCLCGLVVLKDTTLVVKKDTSLHRH